MLKPLKSIPLRKIAFSVFDKPILELMKTLFCESGCSFFILKRLLTYIFFIERYLYPQTLIMSQAICANMSNFNKTIFFGAMEKNVAISYHKKLIKEWVNFGNELFTNISIISWVAKT